MANCTYTEVRRIIDTSLEDTDITALIVLADAEIAERNMSGNSNIKKTISMLLTASLCAAQDPETRSIGEYSESTKTAEEFRALAETYITRIRTPRGRRG